MSFQHRNLKSIGYNHSGSPALFSYVTDVDTLAVVEAADYFTDAKSDIVAGDFILAQASDGSAMLKASTPTTASTLGSGESGWGNYVDTVYTEGSPFAVTANTDTNLPNNKGSVIESQLPPDVDTFYDGTTITGRNGDSICMTLNMNVKPTSAGATYFEVWVDIGGAVGELYRRIVTFPKGQDVERPVTISTIGYTLDTWESNGATVKCRCNGTADVYDIRYVITRTHKAR